MGLQQISPEDVDKKGQRKHSKTIKLNSMVKVRHCLTAEYDTCSATMESMIDSQRTPRKKTTFELM